MIPLFASTPAPAEHGGLSFLHTMSGPDFLMLYGLWFIATFGAVLFAVGADMTRH